MLERELIAAIKAQDFGAELQEKAEKYRVLCPHGEYYEMFRAEAAFVRGDMDTTLHFAETAYHKRRMSTAVCDFLYRVYYAAGRYDRASSLFFPRGVMRWSSRMIQRSVFRFSVN